MNSKVGTCVSLLPLGLYRYRNRPNFVSVAINMIACRDGGKKVKYAQPVLVYSLRPKKIQRSLSEKANNFKFNRYFIK